MLNLIDMIPCKLEVAQTEIWAKKDTSKIKDFTTVEVISDWTFSTPYKGTVHFLTNQVKHIKELTSLDLHKISEEADKDQVLKVELTEQQIPFDRLGQQNPIIHFG